jgi:hypothetical protein
MRTDYGEWLDFDGVPMCCICRRNRSHNEDTLRFARRLNGKRCPFCSRIRGILRRYEGVAHQKEAWTRPRLNVQAAPTARERWHSPVALMRL